MTVSNAAVVRGQQAEFTPAPADNPNGNWNVLEWDEAGTRYRVSFTETSLAEMIDILDRLTRPDSQEIDQLLSGPPR